MKTIMVDAGLGITMDNIPGQVFQAIQGNFYQCSDGGPKFNINDNDQERIVDMIRRKAMTLNRTNVEIVTIGDTILKIRPRLANQTTEIADLRETADREIAEREEREEINEFDDDDEVEEDVLENEEQVEALFQGGIVQIGETPPPIGLFQDDTIMMIAATMENEVSNLARNLKDKIDKLSRAWTRILVLRREIDEATAPVANNPIITELVEQANRLREADNLVEDIVFVADRAVVIRTKELTTFEPIQGSIRKIGRMQIRIDLKPIVGSSSETPNPVEIKNLDREYLTSSDGSGFQCAHVSTHNGICWGTSWELLFNAMESRDLEAIVEVIIRFIRTPNEADSWGSHIVNWPIETEGGGLIEA